MKLYVAISCGLAFGLVVGMLVPRDELLRLRREHRRAALSLSRCESGSQSAFGELFDVARPTGPGPTPGQVDSAADGGAMAATEIADGGVTNDVVVAEPASEPTRAFGDGGVPPGDPDRGEAAAIDLRAHQARAALREQAGLDETQMERLDTIAGEMNEQLANRVRETISRGRRNHGV